MKNFLILISLVVLLAASLPFFHSGIFITHDGENHIARLANYFQAFSDGQIPPRWAPNINYHYGSPAFLFFYPFPGYLGSFFHSLGLGFVDSFKLTLLLGFLLAPFSFFLWMKNRFSPFIACVSALAYGLIPYHILDVYVRGDVGEVLSFVFLPIIFLFIDKNNQKISLANTMNIGISYMLLLLSHNIMSLIFTPVFILYILVFSKTRASLMTNFSGIAIGLLGSAFFWLPALLESKYLNKEFIGSFYQQNFPTVEQLIYAPWNFGADIRKPDALSVEIGFIQIASFISGICIVFFSKYKRELLFWLAVSLVGFFMTLSISEPIWSHVPLLPQFQFPWRFVSLITFSCSILFAHVLSVLKRKFFFAIFVILIGVVSLPIVKVNGFTMKNDMYYKNFPGTTYFHGEATTRWTAGDESSYPKTQYAIVSGDGLIVTAQRNSIQHLFTIHAKDTVEVLDNTVFFPGWLVYIDGKSTPIEFQNPFYRGLITFHVPPGNHTVKVIFKQTRIRRIGDGITLVIFSLILVALVFSQYNKRYGKK